MYLLCYLTILWLAPNITLQAKKQKEHECNALRERAARLEDKADFLSSKVKETMTELKSSHAYIDKLYSDLQRESTRSPSKELKADFERREKEWMELEREYSQRIKELEGRLVYGSKKNVSMEAFMSMVKQTRYYKLESMRNEQTIDELKSTVSKLKEQLDLMQTSVAKNGGRKSMRQNMKPKRVSPVNDEENVVPSLDSRKNGGGKSLSALQYMKSKRVSPNEENMVPSNPKQQYRSSSQQKLGVKHQGGKPLSRVAAVKAAGGRKGLSEQLKRARRFGGSVNTAE